MATVQDRLHDFRQYLHREAGERVWSVGGALRVHLNNFSVDVLKDYIALSRHQFELIEFVTQRTGMDTSEPMKFEVMNWSKGRPEIWIDRGKPRTDEVQEWELQMLEDMAWRAQAMGRSLSRFESNMTINSAKDLMELSRHQCEMLNFIKTGSFRKVPRRRKARTISNGGATPESGERIRLMGEALREYQGRIEIRTVREFIALSKHQCELAGLLFAEAKSGQSVFQVVGYGKAYGLRGKDNGNVDSCFHRNDDNSSEGTKAFVCHSRESGNPRSIRSKTTKLDDSISWASRADKSEQDDKEESADGSNSTFSSLTGESRPDGYACKGRLPQFDAVKLDPDSPHTLPRVPLLPGGMVPLPADGRWVRVDTPDGPMAMRSVNPSGAQWLSPEPVWFDNVWDDDYWDEDWDDP